MTDLALPPELAPAPTTQPNGLVPFSGLTRDQVELLKKTICKDATDDELDLFVYVCNSRRLNPFTKQIHFVKRKQWNGRLNGGRGGYEEVGTHQTGIDGYRLIAERTGRYGGPVGTWWCGPDGKWRDVWLEDYPPSAAKVAVRRTDFGGPSEEIARWKAYVQTKGDGKPNAMWAQRDAEQLAKCAEALVLRKVFPEELSGIYTTDEMAQASNDAVDYQTGEVLDPPALEAGSGLPGGRICPRGVEARTPHNHAYCLAQWDRYKQSDPGSRNATDAVGGDPASASPGSGQPSGAGDARADRAGSRVGGGQPLGAAAPAPDTTSPSTPEPEAGTDAGRSGVEGANHDGKPGDGPPPVVATPPEGSATPPGRPSGGNTSPAGGGAKGARPPSVRGRQSSEEESHGAAVGRASTEEADQAKFEAMQAEKDPGKWTR